MASRERGSRSASAVFGLLIMGLGVVLLLDRLGRFDVEPLWRLWPSALILMGVGQLARPQASRSVCWGVTLVLLGISYLGVNYNVLGMTWHNSWPLAIVAFGIGLVLEALTGPSRTCR